MLAVAHRVTRGRESLGAISAAACALTGALEAAVWLPDAAGALRPRAGAGAAGVDPTGDPPRYRRPPCAPTSAATRWSKTSLSRPSGACWPTRAAGRSLRGRAYRGASRQHAVGLPVSRQPHDAAGGRGRLGRRTRGAAGIPALAGPHRCPDGGSQPPRPERRAAARDRARPPDADPAVGGRARSGRLQGLQRPPRSQRGRCPAGPGRAGLERSAARARHARPPGGDEFTALLPECDLRGACEVAARLRAATPEGVRVSTGSAEWDGHALPESALHRADEALYAAKRRARDGRRAPWEVPFGLRPNGTA